MSSCNFVGNSDAYGLGIRVGLYFQWFATAVAALLAPEELDGFMDVNTSFTFAVLLVLIYLTATRGDTLQSGSLYAVEAFILATLCLAGSACGILAAPLPADSPSLRLAFRKWLTFRVLLLGAALIVLNIYAIWFWSVGMYRMARLSCGDKIFVLQRTDLFGPFRNGALFCHSLFSLLMIGVIGLGGFHLLHYAVTEREAPICGSELEPTEELGDGPSESPGTVRPNVALTELSGVSYLAFHLRRMERVVRPYFLIGYVMPFVAVIEVTIKYNHIQGVQNVNSTGQLIPLFIGVLSFLQLLSKVEYKTALQGVISALRPAREWRPESESEERKDEEANPGTRPADEDKHNTQANAEEALELGYAIQGKEPGGVCGKDVV